GEIYWLWRDRKGLIASPLGLAANVLFLYGLVTRMAPAGTRIMMITGALALVRLGVRMTCVARVYGMLFALGVPIRAVYANVLNAASVFMAIGRYTEARLSKQRLKWIKTDHAFPSRVALLAHKRKLGEILVASGYVTEAAVNRAVATKPASVRLGEHLVGLR